MTIDGLQSAEQRIGAIHDELRGLVQRVDALTARLDALTAAVPPAVANPAAARTVVASRPAAESPLSWVGHSRLLQRLAMISFVLVVALVLRTLTDSGIIALEVGVVLGVSYSVLLVAWGTLLLARKHRGQRVLPVCGGVLLCAVVVEAHQSFGLLAAATTYWVLLADLLVLSWLGFRFGMGSVVAIPALATIVSALALDFPNLQFPHAALVLLCAIVVAHLAQRRLQLPWLAWTTFLATMFFWLLWAMKARAGWLRPESMAPGLQLDWFLPILGAFVLLFLVLAAQRTIANPRDPSGFIVFSPTANVLFGHGTAAVAMAASGGNQIVLGGVTVAAAAVHFGIARQLWWREQKGAIGITAFTLAGTAASVLAAPLMLGGFGLVAPVWAGFAFGLIVLATTWSSPGLRLASYLLQIAVLVFALLDDLYAVPAGDLLQSLVGAGAVSALGILHYHWSRLHLPPPDTWFARLDRNNHGSILLLWLAAANGFGLLRLCVYYGITLLGTEVPKTFQCAQSMLVNFASIGLMLAGMLSRNKQVLLTAVLVAVYGGMRVFGSDLLSASGVPLVLSVFSFGVAAAVGSLVLGKLQSQRATTSN